MDAENKELPPAAPQPASGKIFGMSKAMFFGVVAVLAAVAIWKSGLVEKLFPSAPMNVNTASYEQLKDLPGVDKKIAEDIIAKRPFKDVDDLKRVKGIGEKKIEELRGLVTVGNDQ